MKMNQHNQERSNTLGKYLFKCPFIPFYRVVAKKFGINETVILQQIHYESHYKEPDSSGYCWVKKSRGNWEKVFPFWSWKTVKRTLDKLQQKGIIETMDNPSLRPRLKAYRINYELLPPYLNLSKGTTKLVNEYFIPLFSDVAKELGVNKVLILQQIYRNSCDEKPDVNGYRWVSRSYNGWLKICSWWSIGTVRRILSELIRDQFLILAKEGAQTATNRYRINYPSLGSFLHPSLSSLYVNTGQNYQSNIGQNCQSCTIPSIYDISKRPKDILNKDLKDLPELSSTNSGVSHTFFPLLNETPNPPNNESSSQSLSDIILAISKKAETSGDAIKILQNATRTLKKRGRTMPRKTTIPTDEQFKIFWDLYGRKVDEEPARTAFKKLRWTKEFTFDYLIERVKIYIKAKPKGYRKYSATFLNAKNKLWDGDWEGEIEINKQRDLREQKREMREQALKPYSDYKIVCNSDPKPNGEHPKVSPEAAKISN